MFRWLKKRSLRRMPLDHLLDAILTGAHDHDNDSTGIFRERLQHDPRASLAMLAERLKTAGDARTLKRCLDAVETVALHKTPPVDEILALLQSYLREDQPESVRSGAISALTSLADARAVPQLIRVFGTESSETSTFFLQLALGKLRAKEAVPRLAKNARIQKSESIRTSACQALGDIGGDDAVAHLRTIFEHERSDRVQLAAAIALASNVDDRDANEYLDRTFVHGSGSQACTVALHHLSHGRRQWLQRLIDRLRADTDGSWTLSVKCVFPQLPVVVRVDWVTSGCPKRVLSRCLRWLERNASTFTYDAANRRYLVPGLPVP